MRIFYSSPCLILFLCTPPHSQPRERARAPSNACLRFDHMATAASGRVRAIQKQAKLNRDKKRVYLQVLLEFTERGVARAHAQVFDTLACVHTLAIYSERAACHLSIIRIRVSSLSFPTDSWRKRALQVNKLRGWTLWMYFLQNKPKWGQ